MDTATTEQALRQEAIRRRLAGERRGDICRALGRTTRWLDKWWAEHQRQPTSTLADRSRAPHTAPHQMPAAVASAVVNIRKRLAAATRKGGVAQTPETRYSTIGARTIAGQLGRLGYQDIPSLSSIQRLLRAKGLTCPLGAGAAKAYYPWPLAWEVNAIQATDLITRHLRGGLAIENFHTIDHYSHAVWLGQFTNQTAATTRQFLLENWAELGLPRMHQFDNGGAFSGGHTHARVLGQVVRLCLFCGIEPIFTPFYDARRNYQIETFHSLWVKQFWSRHRFRSLAHVQRLAPDFRVWYLEHYFPPTLDGQTPSQVQGQARRRLLTPALQRCIPPARLPLTRGRIHFMRKVSGDGQIRLLNEVWPVDPKLAGEYVRATVNLAEQRLTVWRQAATDDPWKVLKTRQFRLKEPLHDLLPVFRQNSERCRDYYPD